METIDKIIKSSTAPKRKDVVWFDTTTGGLKIFGTSGWNTVSGGSNIPDITVITNSATEEITVQLPDYLESALHADISDIRDMEDMLKYVYMCSAKITFEMITPSSEKMIFGPVEGTAFIVPDMLASMSGGQVVSYVGFNMINPQTMQNADLKFVRDADNHIWKEESSSSGDTYQIRASYNAINGTISNFSFTHDGTPGTYKAELELNVSMGGQSTTKFMNGTLTVDQSCPGIDSDSSTYDRIGIFMFEYLKIPRYIKILREKSTGNWTIFGYTMTEALNTFASIDDNNMSSAKTYSSSKIEDLLESIDVKLETEPDTLTFEYINPFTNTDPVYLGDYRIGAHEEYTVYKLHLYGVKSGFIKYRTDTDPSVISEAPIMLYVRMIDDAYYLYMHIKDNEDEYIYRGEVADTTVGIDEVQLTKIYPTA